MGPLGFPVEYQASLPVATTQRERLWFPVQYFGFPVVAVPKILGSIPGEVLSIFMQYHECTIAILVSIVVVLSDAEPKSCDAVGTL